MIRSQVHECRECQCQWRTIQFPGQASFVYDLCSACVTRQAQTVLPFEVDAEAPR